MDFNNSEDMKRLHRCFDLVVVDPDVVKYFNQNFCYNFYKMPIKGILKVGGDLIIQSNSGSSSNSYEIRFSDINKIHFDFPKKYGVFYLPGVFRPNKRIGLDIAINSNYYVRITLIFLLAKKILSKIEEKNMLKHFKSSQLVEHTPFPTRGKMDSESIEHGSYVFFSGYRKDKVRCQDKEKNINKQIDTLGYELECILEMLANDCFPEIIKNSNWERKYRVKPNYEYVNNEYNSYNNESTINNIKQKISNQNQTGLVFGGKEQPKEEDYSWFYLYDFDIEKCGTKYQGNDRHIVNINNNEELNKIRGLFDKVKLNLTSGLLINNFLTKEDNETANNSSIINLLKDNDHSELIVELATHPQVLEDYNNDHIIINYKANIITCPNDIYLLCNKECKELLKMILNKELLKKALLYFNKVEMKKEKKGATISYSLVLKSRVKNSVTDRKTEQQYIKSIKILDEQLYRLKHEVDSIIEELLKSNNKNYNWKRLTSNDYKKGPEPSEWTQSYRPKQSNNSNNNQPAITSSNKKPLPPIIGLSILLFITIAIGVYSLVNQEDDQIYEKYQDT